MKFKMYCIECQLDGPTVTMTVAGPAWGNPIPWKHFMTYHANCSDSGLGLARSDQ